MSAIKGEGVKNCIKMPTDSSKRTADIGEGVSIIQKNWQGL